MNFYTILSIVMLLLLAVTDFVITFRMIKRHSRQLAEKNDKIFSLLKENAEIDLKKDQAEMKLKAANNKILMLMVDLNRLHREKKQGVKPQ